MAVGGQEGTWTNHVIGTRMYWWFVYYQIIHAIRQREQCLGNRYFPRTSVIWTEGIITSMGNTWLKDDSKKPIIKNNVNTNPDSWPVGRWNNYRVADCPQDQRIPKWYEVIIYSDAFDEPWKIVRAFVTGNDEYTLNFNDIGLKTEDTDGFIGKRFAVIKQFGIWWHERIPPWPNPPTYFEVPARDEWLINGRVTAVDIAHHKLTLTIKEIPFSPVSVTWKIKDTSYTATVNANSPTIEYTDMAIDGSEFDKEVHYKFNDNRVFQSNSVSWAVNKYVGKAFAYKERGRVRIKAVTSNTSKTITINFGTNPPDTQTPFAVFTVSTLPPPFPPHYTFDHSPEMPLRWTGTPQKYTWSHYIDDTIWGAGGIALNSVQWTRYPEPCVAADPEIVTEYMFDRDLWSGTTEKIIQDPSPDTGASGPDTCFTPNHWKSWRAYQRWCEDTSGNWVEHIDWTGWQSKTIPHFNPSYCFGLLNINVRTATVKSIRHVNDGGVWYHYATFKFTNPLPYYPCGFYYHFWRGYEVAAAGWAVANSQEVELPIQLDDVKDINKTVNISLGWTRKVPNEFMTMFDQTYFEPDMDFSGPIPTPVVPPTAEYPGNYLTEAKSMGYKEAQDERFGATAEGLLRNQSYGKCINSSTFKFKNGDKARYVGKNFKDTTMPEAWDAYAKIDEAIRAVDRGTYQGVYRNYKPTLTGVATEGSQIHLYDETQNWYQWGEMLVHIGTCTGGSNVTFHDHLKFDPDNGFWNGSTTRWVDFIVQLTKSGVTRKTVITAYNPVGQTATIIDCGIVVDNTTTYRISEPYGIRNRFRDREVKIKKKTTGTVYTVKVTHSDANHLFFTAVAGLTVEPGDTFEIIEPEFGTIWQWDLANTKWIVPTGWTASQQKWSQPSVRTMYGRAMKDDYEPSIVELKSYINLLKDTEVDVAYHIQYPDPDPQIISFYPTNVAYLWNSNIVSNTTGHVGNMADSWATVQGSIWSLTTREYKTPNYGDYSLGDFVAWVQKATHLATEPGPMFYSYDEKMEEGSGLKNENTRMEEVTYQPRISGIPIVRSCAKDVYSYSEKVEPVVNTGTYTSFNNTFNNFGMGFLENAYKKIKTAPSAFVTGAHWDYIGVQPAEASGSVSPDPNGVFPDADPYGLMHPTKVVPAVFAPVLPSGQWSFVQTGLRITKTTCVLKWDVTYA
jgi:hypothetical protein